MQKRVGFISIAVLIACGGPAPEPGPPPAETATTAGEERAPIFVLARVRLLDPDNEGIEIAADGVMQIAGQPFGRWTADGRFVDSDGTTQLQVADDGVLRTAAGEPLAQLDGDVLRIGEHALSIGADGVVRGVPDDAPELRIVPADSPARRVALTALGMWLYMAASVAQVEEQAVEAVEPTMAPSVD